MPVAMKAIDPGIKIGSQDDIFYVTLGDRLKWYTNSGQGVLDIAAAQWAATTPAPDTVTADPPRRAGPSRRAKTLPGAVV